MTNDTTRRLWTRTAIFLLLTTVLLPAASVRAAVIASFSFASDSVTGPVGTIFSLPVTVRNEGDEAWELIGLDGSTSDPGLIWDSTSFETNFPTTLAANQTFNGTLYLSSASSMQPKDSFAEFGILVRSLDEVRQGGASDGITVSTVFALPEPSALVFCLLGLGGIGYRLLGSKGARP